MPLIDFSPPAQSWADYLETLPAGRAPRAQDIFDRWDSRMYICPARPRNNATEALKHREFSLEPGMCACGVMLKPGQLRGEGERRAYRAWLAQMMDSEESAHFWATVVSTHPDQLMQLAIVPVVREMFKWLREIEGEGQGERV